MTPASTKLLNQYRSALSNEIITGEQEFSSLASCRKYQAITEASRNALEAHIEKLERAAGALRAIKARIDGVFDDPDLTAFGPLSTDSCEDVYKITTGALP